MELNEAIKTLKNAGYLVETVDQSYHYCILEGSIETTEDEYDELEKNFTHAIQVSKYGLYQEIDYDNREEIAYYKVVVPAEYEAIRYTLDLLKSKNYGLDDIAFSNEVKSTANGRKYYPHDEDYIITKTDWNKSINHILEIIGY